MLIFIVLLLNLIVCQGRNRIFVTSIVPNNGPLTGNTRVLVRGSNLEPSDEYPIPLCKFGTKNNIVRGTYVTCTPLPRNPDDPEPTTPEKSSYCIQCDPSPPGLEEDMVPFLVSITGDFSDVENSVEFEYYTPPVIDYIVPKYGNRNGGTTVTVYGRNFIDFDQYLRCFFGTKAVPGIYVSDTIMQCVSPFSDVVIAAMPFKITLNDQQTTSDDINYYFYPKPAIMRLNPTKSPVGGGILVEIEGQNLDPFNDVGKVDNHNDTFCKFGGSDPVPANVISDAKITCMTPPSQVVRTVFVDITLNNADLVLNAVDWTDNHVPFTYFAAPYIYTSDPTLGPKTGNSTVTILGNNFNDTSNIKCKFGNKVVPGRYKDSNTIVCTSPPANNTGPVDLSVSMNDENFGNPIRYTYYALAEVYSIRPICGPRTGYTQITVTGKNFVYSNPDSVKCLFDNLEQTPATVISDTEIRCDSPDIHLKPYYKQVYFNVSVTLNGNDRSNNTGNIRFGYYDFQSLYDISPNFGPISGGTVVYVRGDNFTQKAVCNVTVRFGTVEVVPVYYNDSYISVTTPQVSMPGLAIVQTALNGQQFTDFEGPKNLGGSKYDTAVLDYYYYEAPVITGFSPLGGPSSGNSVLYVYGAGFGEEGSPVYLRFKHSSNNSEISTIQCNDVQINKVTCYTPRTRSGSVALLELSRNGQNYVQAPNNTYMFYESPSIVSISPKIGPVKNQLGGNITVTGTSFKCTTPSCEKLTCKYGTNPYPLYVQGHYTDSSHVLCPIISYSRPEVVAIEVSLNGIDYTNDGVNYTFFDAFVLNADPRFFTEAGGTNVSVLGFGFADTGSEVKFKIGSPSRPLLCNGGDCIYQGTYVNDHEILCKMPPRTAVTYQDTGDNVMYDLFPIEISVKDQVFTTSNISIRYIQNPEYLSINSDHGSANGFSYVIVQTNFHWDSTSEYDIIKYSNVKCRFFSKNTEAFMQGSIINYPFVSDGDPNAVSCLSPPWPTNEKVNIQVTLNGKDYGGNFAYNYLEKISGQYLSPACGPNKGETKVTMQGNGFNDISGLHFKWGTESRPANQETLFSESSGTISGYSPPTRSDKTHGGFVFVEIGQNSDINITTTSSFTLYGEYTKNKLLYFYYKEPTLNYLHPRGGSELGENLVTLHGSWFVNYEAVSCTPRCKFGDTVVPGEFLSTVKVRCSTPPNTSQNSLVEVEISFNGQDWTESHLKYLYYKTPVIYSISPLSGPSTGGTMISLQGANFTGDAYPEEFICKFTSLSINAPKKYVPAVYKSENLIYCTLPGGWGSGTEVKVDVTFNGIDYTNSDTKFNIFQIDYVSPKSGPSDGSSKGIVIYGSGFIPNDGAVCVIENKDVKPTSITWNKVICPLPKSSLGSTYYGNVPLEVSVNGIDFQKYPRGFQYYEQPTVSGIKPTSGPVSGGALISVYGGPFVSNFEAANVTCSIGDFISSAKVVDENTIQCISPVMERPKNGTMLNVRVSLNGQDYTTNTNTYSVYGLIDSAPKGGPSNGGTEVLIKGFGFYNNEPRCRFGVESNNIVVEAKLVDENHLICTVPCGFKIPTGSVLPLDIPLEIGFSDGSYHPWTHTDNKFRLYENPKILSLSPQFGYVDLTYEINVVADEKKGFYPALTGWKNSGELDVMHSIVCRFEGYGDVPAVYLNRTNIKCLTPDTGILRKNIHSETAKVLLAMNGQDFFDIGNYTFKGSASGLWVVLMWLGLVILIVAIIILLGILVSKYYDGVPMFPNQPDSGRVSGALGPHVFREVDGQARPVSSQNK